jgi:lipopolysaccharide transport system permease protein
MADTALGETAGALRRASADEAVRVTTIVPPRRWPELGLAEAWRLRRVCVVLAERILKVRYRQAAVGIGWALIQPLLLMLAFTVFFGLLTRMPTENVPYPLFFFSGLTIWQVMAKMLSEGSNSVLANTALVTRIYFPRVYFPVSVALSTLVDLFFALLALGVLMLYFGFIPGAAVLALPLVLVVIYASALGVTLWLSALNVAYRDVAVLVPFITQVGFFLSPIIYPASIVPAQFQLLYFLNPMALGIEGFRWALLHTPAPSLAAWVVSCASATLLLASGYVFFRKREGTFADLI